MILGVYDRSGNFANSSDMNVDVWFIRDWNQPLTNIDNSGLSLTAACQQSAANNRVPLVTIFPVHDPLITKRPANTLEHITAGKYDSQMRNIAAQMRAYGGPAYLRWGPGMDDPNNLGRYDWCVPPSQASAYTDAYQRRHNIYVSYTNSLANQKFIWAPTGNSDSYLYFPGYSFCDYVGCTAYGWSIYQGQSASGFSNVLGLKYSYMSQYNLPLFVEMGCEKGDPQSQWANDMRANYANFSLLNGAWWFNGRADAPWTPTGAVPDFSTDPSIWHA